MTTDFWITTFIILLIIAPIPVSWLVEYLRPKPSETARLPWAPSIPVQHVDVDGNRLRYIKTGEGPKLVLLHTLRTQLDIFQKMIPLLSPHFTVYALDYPGHGWSDIPEDEYEPQIFLDAVSGFLEALDIQEAVLAGISIGGSVCLVEAARNNPRVDRVIAINPYDYGNGGGLQRSSPVAKLIFTLAKVPILGSTVMRMRNRMVEDRIFAGGVSDGSAIPEDLLKEFYEVGCRPGHYQAFMKVVKNAGGWDGFRSDYEKIRMPVLLVYGEQDWSRRDERAANEKIIPGVTMLELRNSGHFSALDAPEELGKMIIEFGTSTSMERKSA